MKAKEILSCGIGIGTVFALFSIANYHSIRRVSNDINIDGYTLEKTSFEHGNGTEDEDHHDGGKNDDTWWRGNNSMSLVEHPHLGAMHKNGTLGMIIDPSPLRMRLFDPKENNDDIIQHSVLCPVHDNATKLQRIGIEEEGGSKILQMIKGGIVKSKEFLRLQDVAIDEMIDSVIMQNRTLNLTINPNLTLTVPIDSSMNKNVTSARAKKSKILCMVYTVHLPPDYDNRNVRAQAETWGQQCDGFIAASNMTDHDTGSINLPHLGPEMYGNMWQKVRSMWAYAHDHYRDEFDFFHICGDDVYLFVDNLRAYLDGPEVTSVENGKCKYFYWDCKWTSDTGPRPLYFGRAMPYKGIVPAGGPGYTLNRAALEILNRQLDTHLTDDINSREDIYVGGAFHGAGIEISQTSDANGGERYGHCAQSQFDFDGTGPTLPKVFHKTFGLPPPKMHMESISDQFVSAHLKPCKKSLKEKNHTVAELMYRYHAILNDWCQ